MKLSLLLTSALASIVSAAPQLSSPTTSASNSKPTSTPWIDVSSAFGIDTPSYALIFCKYSLGWKIVSQTAITSDTDLNSLTCLNKYGSSWNVQYLYTKKYHTPACRVSYFVFEYWCTISTHNPFNILSKGWAINLWTKGTRVLSKEIQQLPLGYQRPTLSMEFFRNIYLLAKVKQNWWYHQMKLLHVHPHRHPRLVVATSSWKSW